MAKKIITAAEAAKLVPDGSVVMIGGFMGCGNPHNIVDELLAQGVKDLTMICNDTSIPEFGVGKLIVAKRIKKLIASHIGLNPQTGLQMNSGEIQVELAPQGTLAERIRAAGAGLGGFLTPTGVGTPVEEGKKRLTIDGKDYLLETPLRANVALINAKKADKAGNLIYNFSANNFNQTMATAADLVIAEVEEIVEEGQLDPNAIHTQGVFVDYLVQKTCSR